MSPKIPPDIAQKLTDIFERLDRIDKALGLRDCKVEEENKKKFLDHLQQIIKAADAAKALTK